MAVGRWISYLRPHPNSQTPSALRLLVAAVSGAALSLSFTGFYLAVYAWICIGILMVVLFGARPRMAFACGFLHAVIFGVTSEAWIAGVLSVHGDVSPLASWGLLLMVVALWGIAAGGFAWLVNRLARRSIAMACVGAPFIWVAAEFLHGRTPEIGFPWNLLGYSASANLGLLQVTSVTGVYGLSFLMMCYNALLAWADSAAAPRTSRRLGILAGSAAAILLLYLATPRLVPAATANHVARAVQLNFPETNSYENNWLAQHAAEMGEIARLSLKRDGGNPDLLVWPEAPAPFSEEDPQFASFASSLTIRLGHPFLVGTVEWRKVPFADGKANERQVPYNSAVLIDKQGQRVFTYDKIHLVPFGEYEPFPLIHQVVSSVSSEVGGFAKGTRYSVGPLPGGFSFATFICYEAIFPGEIRQFANDGAQLFINISNDGWFGRSAAAEQHLRMARVRAAENRRWIIRSTNNGYTASIDPYGRMYRPLPPDVRAAANLPYDFRSDKTLYTRFGDWFAWLCVLVSFILFLWTFVKRGGAGENIAIPVVEPPVVVLEPPMATA
ncbi:MAG: apolipoprotein N-acyltransferase [Candidatus Acidiferrum sp.]|jgi:apolipoprotein N-acyltransferase